jgi:proline iminopeptidase
MRDRYPPIEPYDHGLLDVGDGNLVYWETCGNPAGKPVLSVHGGPGSGCSPNSRRYFDPERYRIVLFDQRNCGRSRPSAADPTVDLSTNTTDHLIADMELLREHLGIDRWMLFGGSWGCVLSLVYAERHPDRVTELVQMGLATGRGDDVELLTRGLGGIFPQAFARYVDLLPESERDNIPAGYSKLLNDPDAHVRDRAMRAWCDWEDAMLPYAPAQAMYEVDADHAYAFTRLVTHYWSQDHFLADNEVLANAERLAHIPTVLVQGVLDLGNLVGTPWLLAQALPHAELIMVPGEGHSLAAPGMRHALVTATDKFAEKTSGRVSIEPTAARRVGEKTP